MDWPRGRTSWSNCSAASAVSKRGSSSGGTAPSAAGASRPAASASSRAISSAARCSSAASPFIAGPHFVLQAFQGPGPQLPRRVGSAIHELADLVERPALVVAQQQDAAVLLRQSDQRRLQGLRLLIGCGVTARRGRARRELAEPFAGSLAGRPRGLAGDVALAGAAVVAPEVGQLVQKHLSQPGQQLLLGLAV